MVKVSVCIPTYNRAKYLAYSVDSVLEQTYTDFELIICDDASTDNTPEIVSHWNDSRIRYIRHPKNIKRCRNMRSGFEAAIGEYFLKFDDDDGITPEFLAKTVEILDKYPKVDFVCTDHWIINARGERDEVATRENSAKWGKNRLKQGIISDLARETFLHQSLQVGSTLFRRSCLQEVNFMRQEADGCEDFDLLVRCAIAQKEGYFLPELLMEYRFHGAQTSLKQDIHFLSAKVFCINSYRFDNKDLERLRIQKLAGTQQALGLRLIEQGESKKGREFLETSSQVLGKNIRATLGLFLSYLPLIFRKIVLQIFRKGRTPNYAEKVRNT
ncbi:MAG: glycosyltransferase family 2 protein [Xenococcaceae cyanobacterium]